MQTAKASERDKERFRALVPDHPAVEVKPMFGNLGAFVNGNMFAGLFGNRIGLMLADDDRAELARIEGTGPSGPAARPMGGYLSLPEAWIEQPELATPWLERALGLAVTLPPRGKSPRRSPT